jgi:hypothetical protein
MTPLDSSPGKMLFDKQTETRARVLRRILESGPSPCVLGSDNDREFRGDQFLNVLTEFALGIVNPIHLNTTDKLNDFGRL